MTRRSRSVLGSPAFVAGWILGAMLLWAGCSGGQKAEMPPLPPSEHIEAGYSVTVEFPADGRWFGSGFEAFPDDVIIVEPVGDAQSLPREALLMHVGRTVTQFVDGGKPQRVTQRGEIAFRGEPKKAGTLREKPVRVKISNVRGDK